MDVTEIRKLYVLLIEISEGTEGTSKTKAEGDLLKLAKGMRRHLLRLGHCVRGVDTTACRKLQLVGAHVVANVMYFQAMAMIGEGVSMMWEWSKKTIPRSVPDMWNFGSTLGSSYTLKEIIMETKSIIQAAKYEEATTAHLCSYWRIVARGLL